MYWILFLNPYLIMRNHYLFAILFCFLLGILYHCCPLLIKNQHSIEKQQILDQLGDYSESFLDSTIFFYETKTGAVRHTDDIPDNIFKPSNNPFCYLFSWEHLCHRTTGKLRDTTDESFVRVCNEPIYSVSIYYPLDDMGNVERWIDQLVNDIFLKIVFHVNIHEINQSCAIQNVSVIELYDCMVH